MESYYTVVISILLILAVLGIIVGVSNDAVNFLNSAIGSKVSKRWIIFSVASVGMLLGSCFSNGMIEVAHSGFYHTARFQLYELIPLFLAAMLANVILIDVFNTFGMPISTTVTMVMGIIGAAVGILLIKIHSTQESITILFSYINTSKIEEVFVAIVLSIILAFSAAIIVQYLVRLIFTFDYQPKIKYLGGIFGGLITTAFIYFIIIKGVYETSFVTTHAAKWIESHATQILIFSLIGSTAFFQILFWLKVNSLKLIVHLGTFALALSFAGNNMVNFIGIPIAGLSTYSSLHGLKQYTQTPILYLLIAGTVMVAALWLSRKVKTVMNTELMLSRQMEGYERFNSTLFSRLIVRAFLFIKDTICSFLPRKWVNAIQKRFEKTQTDEPELMFDLVRASVNLFISTILMALGTSLKIPLSSTYVTFMVAMGSSLSDGAWKRENAAYRLSGMFMVISGWFLTAFVTFLIALLFAMIIYLGGIVGIVIVSSICIGIGVYSNKIHSQREHKLEKNKVTLFSKKVENILEICTNDVIDVLSSSALIFNETIEGLIHEDQNRLLKAQLLVNDLSEKTKLIQQNINQTATLMKEKEVGTFPNYVQVTDYLQEIVHCVMFINKPCRKHIVNQHKPMFEAQIEELNTLKESTHDFYLATSDAIKNYRFSDFEKIVRKEQDILQLLKTFRKNQIKRIKEIQAGTHNSTMYLNILNEVKYLLLHTIKLLKAQRDFVVLSESKNNLVENFEILSFTNNFAKKT